MGIQGSPISPEIKRKILSVKEYFDRQHGDGDITPSDLRTADALDIGVATVRRVMADFKKNPKNLFENPIKIDRGRPPKLVPDSIQTIIRDYIRDANKIGQFITLEILCDFLKEREKSHDFNPRTLSRALERWGFVFGKGVRTSHLKESDYVVLARRKYLRKKLENRNGNTTHRPEVYLDESYINKNHSNDFTWYFGEDGPWINKPTGNGERAIILDAITETGWVPNARLIFKSSRKTGDYHGQMNYEIFSKWIEEKLLPNIPEKSLIIFDNAPYHNKFDESSPPTLSSSKQKIKDWLTKEKIPFREDFIKLELFDLLPKSSMEPIYAIDSLIRKHRHEVLRTPQYHPELQPIETCWGIVKNEVARKCDFTMKNTMKKLDLAFSSAPRSAPCSPVKVRTGEAANRGPQRVLSS